MQNVVVKNEDTIRQWLIDHLAKILKIDQRDIDINVPFDRYGLDSSAAVELTGDLGEWLNRKLEPTLLYDYATVKSLCGYLAQ